MPLICPSEGFLVSYSTERLPIWDEGEDIEFPEDGQMARKRFMATGGDVDFFYESGAAAETWLTCKEP